MKIYYERCDTKMIHLLSSGRALCGMHEVPAKWPEGHRWVDVLMLDRVTCPGCRANARVDVCAVRHGGADTSVEAQNSTAPSTRDTIRNAICEFIRVQGHYGATCEVVEHSMSLSHQSASARISELLRDGRIEIAEGRSRTKTGRSCRIYVAKP